MEEFRGPVSGKHLSICMLPQPVFLTLAPKDFGIAYILGALGLGSEDDGPQKLHEANTEADLRCGHRQLVMLI